MRTTPPSATPSVRSWSRPCTMTDAPSAASISVMARPRPALDPVISARLPVNPMSTERPLSTAVDQYRLYRRRLGAVYSLPWSLVSTDSPRRRDAAATREAILESAIRNFARAGYDGVGVREIAGDAGVTAMLVNRYFGSKEQLFAEAVEVSFAPAVFVSESPQSLTRDAAAVLVSRSAPDADELAPFLIMLRSASNPRATEIVRDAIERHVGRRLSAQLPDPGARLRSDVVLSVISGVLLMRRVVGARALNRKNAAEQLATLLEAVLDAIVETPLN